MVTASDSEAVAVTVVLEQLRTQSKQFWEKYNVKFIFYCSMKHNISLAKLISSGYNDSDGQDTLYILWNHVKWICLEIKFYVSVQAYISLSNSHTLSICSKGLSACMICAIERNKWWNMENGWGVGIKCEVKV